MQQAETNLQQNYFYSYSAPHLPPTKKKKFVAILQ